MRSDDAPADRPVAPAPDDAAVLRSQAALEQANAHMAHLHRGASVLRARWDEVIASPLPDELNAFAAAVVLDGIDAARLELGSEDTDLRFTQLAEFFIGWYGMRKIERDRMEHEPAAG